jgi:diguanylate cyclase (GGDEF)-like protein
MLEMTIRISFLITVCFTAVIFINSLILIREPTQAGLISKGFVIPLLFAVVSFLYPHIITAPVALAAGEFLLVVVILAVNVLKPSFDRYPPFLIVISVLPVAVLALHYYFPAVLQYLTQNQSIFIGVFLLLNLLVLWMQQQARTMLFNAMVVLAAAAVANRGHANLAVALEFLAYLAFLLYFSQNAYLSAQRRYLEAQQKLARLEKNISLEVKKRTFEIERSNQNLLLISKLDTLTKTFNRMSIINTIDSLLNSHDINPFSIILFDVDHFKTINDTQGHSAGDMVLKKVALLAKQCIRDFDSLGRYGGDEFIITLPGTTLSEAMLVAERFRKRVEQMDPGGITISAGLASYPADGQKVKDLIGVADKGLYLSKKIGRNKVSHV